MCQDERQHICPFGPMTGAEDKQGRVRQVGSNLYRGGYLEIIRLQTFTPVYI